MIKVNPIVDVNLLGYVAKGYVTVEEFEAAIRWQWDKEFVINPKKVNHVVLRCIPTPYERDYNFRYEYSKPGRGAFKATEIYFI